MKEGQTLWTKEQLILALNLYSQLTFGQLHSRNSRIIDLANIIGRNPNAVAMKLVNFASLDPRLKQKGMEKVSKLDRQVWNEYMNNWADLYFEGEKLLAKKRDTTIEKLYKEVERLVKMRVNQTAFRGAVLTNFNNRCCITGIDVTSLIVASHIVPWSKDKENRLSPANGLALNALHDKAFDKHLITVTEDLSIKISAKFYEHKDIVSIKQNFIDYDGKQLIEPKKFYPDVDFLKMHNDTFAAKSSLIAD